MNIYIQQQQLKVGEIEIIAVSSSSNFQVGDNDQVLLYSIAEDVPTSIQIGPFPQIRSLTDDSTLNLNMKKKQMRAKQVLASAKAGKVKKHE